MNVANPVIQPSIQIPGDVVVVVIAENDNARGTVQFDVIRVGSLVLCSVNLLCCYKSLFLA